MWRFLLNRPSLAQSQQLSACWSSFGMGRFAGWMSSRQWTDEAWHRWMRLIWRPPCKAVSQVSAVTENFYHKLLHRKSRYLFVFLYSSCDGYPTETAISESTWKRGHYSTRHEDVLLSMGLVPEMLAVCDICRSTLDSKCRFKEVCSSQHAF